MKILYLLLPLVICLACTENEKKALIFSKTAGFRHSSIEVGQEAVKKLLKEKGIKSTITEDSLYFHEDSLKEFSVVIFLSTTMDVLDYPQQADFERYIQAGGGFVGIHAAADTEYDWAWYNGLVGAQFESHPEQQNAKLSVINKNHASTKMLPDEWKRFDEWYNYKNIVEGLNVTITLDESSYEGGKNGENHPISWYHEYDGGRAFYTGLGHTEETYVEDLFLQHLWGGIEYAIGNDQRDYSKAKSDRMPEENRFVRTVLASNLEEPMELEYLPDGKILFIERKGAVQLYDLNKEKLQQIDSFAVHYEPGEDGLLGLAIDPDFGNNSWIYLYYTALEGESVQTLARFDFKNDKIDRDSKKVLLQIPTIRDCCHSGGSIEFGPKGFLYLSTGDNTNPFESSGYSPSDGRPGREVFDAQKSAANTNDLRGKILRIKPEADGSYSIPEGNLFPQGTELTRPEIYAMGLRNPFRIAIDHKTGNLYWGDVGPDAGKDDPKRGPRGMDEFNQARGPGNWGWPYTRGNNQAYVEFDFANERSLESFDPSNLTNKSVNNTGIENLPPAQQSFIWYPYASSEEFPWVGDGGRNAMAGPIYYSDAFPTGANKFPKYFDGKLLHYDWVRDWIYVITLDENQNFEKEEPFMPNSRFNNPVDIIYGDDGVMYMLEYGEKWYTRNLDARLNKIEFISGNRAPIARIESSQLYGSHPLTVAFNGSSSEDLENDPIQFEWQVNGKVVESKEAGLDYTFQEPGLHSVDLIVSDSEGNTARASVEVVAGNDAPKIEINVDSKDSIYISGKALNYSIGVHDNEDGSTSSGRIASEEVKIDLTFIPEGLDYVQSTTGHQINVLPKGKKLIDGSDCRACHAINDRINGPSYLEIAQKYEEKDSDYLASKIINGGGGVWGESPMSAHPQLKEEDVDEMVAYILSLKEASKPSMPLEGELIFDRHKPENKKGIYVLSVTYADKGNGKIPSLSAKEQIVFKHANAGN